MTDALGYDPKSGDPLYKNWPFLLTKDATTGMAYVICGKHFALTYLHEHDGEGVVQGRFVISVAWGKARRLQAFQLRNHRPLFRILDTCKNACILESEWAYILST